VLSGIACTDKTSAAARQRRDPTPPVFALLRQASHHRRNGNPRLIGADIASTEVWKDGQRRN
jgi:hypothetical protein